MVPRRVIGAARVVAVLGIVAGTHATAAPVQSAEPPKLPLPDGAKWSRVPDSAGAALGYAPPDILGWETINLEGASCGLGAPFKYFLNEADDPNAGLLIYLMPGGACLKSGAPAEGVTGAAAQLHCMAYEYFGEPTDVIHGISAIFPYLNRSRAGNPFADYHFAVVPYCTGDLHAGTKTSPLDYDPSPDRVFEVTHRGHLNVQAVLADLSSRFDEDRPVVLTGSSAGALGAILNYPAVSARWPSTVVIPDAGIVPQLAGSLLDLHGAEAIERWGAAEVLPDYCRASECLSDSLLLLARHAEHHDGDPAPWRPFGYLQGERDATLAAWFEVSPCGYELGLRRSVRRNSAGNLRGYLPATEEHMFLNRNGGFETGGGVQVLQWFAQVARAVDETTLPDHALDPWPSCNAISFPALRAWSAGS